MKATYAQISITEGRHKIMRQLLNGNDVTVTAKITIKADDIINQMEDEDYVTDFTSAIVKDVCQV